MTSDRRPLPPPSGPPRARRMLGLASCAALATLLPATRAAAQAVGVEVRDAVTGAPVPNALVGLRADATDQRLGARLAAEGITAVSGRRTLGVPAGRYRVEVRRIGQRPFVGPVVVVIGADTAAVAVQVPRAPVTLAAVETRATSACRTQADPAVLALWDAARTALATSAEARPRADTVPALTYERVLDTAGTVLGERRTTVAPDSADARVFWAATPAVLETHGFVLGTLQQGAQFHGPDERVLLSDEFARTHCFAPARGVGPNAGWVGVRFTPAPRRRVPEVAGVVWLDSATAEPRRVEFDYQWRALPREARGVGGFVTFARQATGAVGVSSWQLRVPRVESFFGRIRVAGYREVGGVIAAPPTAPRVRVAGIVYDSLLGAPLAGALVTRAGAPGVTLTDAAGAFVLDSVEATPGDFVFSHPALDSIGLADLVAPVDLSAARDTARVTLATPSRATVWARTCAGLPLPARPDTGVLAGMVRDAATGDPIAGGVATVAWTALDTARGRIAGVPRTRALRADSTGAFRFCGIPADVELEVQGAAERSTSGWALVAVGARGLATVDLLVPPPARGAAATARAASAAGDAARAVATVVATGVVRDSLGAPQAGVLVTVEGRRGLQAVTDRAGQFRLPDVPAGTQTIVVRAVGYTPQAVTVGLRTDAPEPVEITLRRVVRLAGVTVRGRAGGNTGFLSALARRQRLGIGSVLDSTLIRRSLAMRAVLQQVPYTGMQRSETGVWSLVTPTGCPLAVAVDGRITEWDEVTDLPPQYVLAIEVYRRTTQVPADFQGLLVQAALRNRTGDTQPCGLALVWTRASR